MAKAGKPVKAPARSELGDPGTRIGAAAPEALAVAEVIPSAISFGPKRLSPRAEEHPAPVERSPGPGRSVTRGSRPARWSRVSRPLGTAPVSRKSQNRAKGQRKSLESLPWARSECMPGTILGSGSSPSSEGAPLTRSLARYKAPGKCSAPAGGGRLPSTTVASPQLPQAQPRNGPTTKELCRRRTFAKHQGLNSSA